MHASELADDSAPGWLRTRLSVVVVLGVHALIVWSAFALRVDHFPLSWAPMYTVLRPGPPFDAPVWDRSSVLVATRRDGAIERLNASALNIPRLSFWRLYYKRMFGRGPAKHDHARVAEGWNAGTRQALGLESPGEVIWDQRVLRAINRSLGRDEASGEFIVSVEARATVLRFDTRGEAPPRRFEVRSQYRWNQPAIREEVPRG